MSLKAAAGDSARVRSDSSAGAEAGARGRRQARRLVLAVVAVMAAVGGVLVASLVAPAAPSVALGLGPERPAAGIGSVAWVDKLGRVEFSSPTYATIGGKRVVVAASLTGEVDVVDASSGKELPGWPRFVSIAKGARPTAVDASPVVAFLDGPGKPPTIIVAAGSLWVPGGVGGVEAFRTDGSVRWRFETDQSVEGGRVVATPAVGDITGSGQQDVVFGSLDHRLYALTPKGTPVKGFPVNRADTIFSSPAVARIGSTRRADIFMGGDATGLADPSGHRCYGGWLTDFRWTAGSLKLRWEHCIGEAVWSSPAVGVINATHRLAVVVGTGYEGDAVTNPAAQRLYAYYADNGARVPGWPVTAKGPTYGSPAIAPAVPGGPPVVFSTSGAHEPRGPAVVQAWSGSGKRLWSMWLNDRELLASPIVANLAGGTGPNDVVVGNSGGVYVLDARNGKLLDGTKAAPLASGCHSNNSAAFSPGGGGMRSYLAVACSDTASSGQLVEFRLAVPSYVSAPWPEFRQNPARTGLAPG